MSLPITGMSATLTDSRKIVGTLSDGPPVGVEEFEEQASVTVTHNRHRDLDSVLVYVLNSEYGEDEPVLEELNAALYEVVYTNVDSFVVTFDHAYTGEVRFY